MSSRSRSRSPRPQEISRNFDTLALAPADGSPPVDAALELRVPGARFDGAANRGNKGLSFRGLQRVQAFAKWAASQPDRTVIVGGHSLWSGTPSPSPDPQPSPQTHSPTLTLAGPR